MDGWRMESNDEAGIRIAQPRTFEERAGVAGRCSAALEITMPLLVDGVENRVEEAYAAFPDRLYVIDREGRVAYQGGRGPFGFQTREMEQALALVLLAEKVRSF